MDRKLLDTFWSFAEGNDNDRIDATSKLLVILRDKQGQSTERCKELNYVLDRLLRGLASSRKWARLGFATAFTQVLRAFPFVEMKTIMEKIQEILKVKKHETKHEQSNVYLGRILAYLVLIQSDKIHQATDSDVRNLVKAVLEVQKKKNPLHQLCSQAIIQLITKMSEEGFSRQVWPLLQPIVTCGWEKCTPDILLLLLTASKHQSSTVNKSFFVDHWGSKKILSEKNMESIASVLMQSTADHPIVHPVCMALLQKASQKPETFDLFWRNVIYGKVFGSGINRKYLIFQLIPEALKMAISEEQVYSILSPSLITTIIKSLSNKQQVLCGAARKMVQSLVKVSAELTQPSLQVAMVIAMVTSPGTVLFDSVTKTRLVSSIVNNLSTEGGKMFSQVLMNNIRGEYLTRPHSNCENTKKDGADLLSQQKWAVDMLSNMTSQESVNKDVSSMSEILHFLFSLAFFDVMKSQKDVKKPSVPIEASLKQVLSSAFFRSLDRVAKSMGKGPGCFQSYCNVLHDTVHYAKSLLGDDHIELTEELDEEILSSWERATDQVNTMKKKREKSSTIQNDEMAFELLFLHHCLQLFSDPQSAMDVLEELHTCYKKASQKKRRRSVAAKSGDEPEWVDVVIDLLMSLLAQQSHLKRTIVNTVFTMLCPHLTKDNVDLILEVLQPVTNSEDNPIAFEDEELYLEDEASAEDSDSDGDDEEDGNSDKEDQETEIDAKFRESVKSALGKAADADTEDEESDEEFDDEKMFKLDGALIAAFKDITKSKKQKEAEKKTQLKHYRMRCLDLLEILIHQTTSASMLLHLVNPLLNLVETGMKEKKQKDLGERATKVYHQLVRTKKFTIDPGFDKADLPKMVKSLMEYSTKVSVVPVIKEVASACVFVLHLVSKQEPTGPSPLKTRAMASAKKQKEQEKQNEHSASMDNILNIIEEGLNDFCLKRNSHMSQYFFQTMFETEPVLLWPLSATILKHAISPDVRIFCRTQAWSMLSVMITKNGVAQLEMNSFIKLAEEIICNIHKIIDNGSKQTLKPRFLTEMLILLHKVISVLNVDFTKQLVSNDLLELLTRIKSGTTANGRQAINRICGIYTARTRNPNQKKKDKKRKRKQQGEGEGKMPNGSPSPEKPAHKQSAADSDGGQSNQKKRLQSPSDISTPSASSEPSATTPSSSQTKKKKRKSNSGVMKDTEGNVTMEDNSENTYSSHKKKKKKADKVLLSPEEVESNSPDFTIDRLGDDKVKLNLAQKLSAAEGMSGKRRNSEVVTGSIDLNESSSRKKKKKRKSMGDIS